MTAPLENPTPAQLRRRRGNTRNAREKRDRKLQAAQLTAQKCPHRHGSGICGGPLTVETDSIGRMVIVCDYCERRKRGLCRDCPRPVYGQIPKAVRCRACAERARKRQVADCEERHRDEYNKTARDRYYVNEARRVERNEQKRLWRLANPDKVRAQKKRYVQKKRLDPSSAYNRYHKRYRKKHSGYYRSLQNTRSSLSRPTPPRCTKCGKKTRWKPEWGGQPWLTCNACAFPFQVRMRRATRRRAAYRLKHHPPKPIKVRPPAKTADRGPGWERLCITEGCETVLTHRKKKCTKCREADAVAARAALVASQGRGRRTDLERVA